MKLKICSICDKETYLWKSKPACCKECWLKIKAQEQSSGPKSYKTTEKKESRSYRIKSVSDKKLIELKEYRKKRDAYMKANPICQFPSCTLKSEDLHHVKGRVGASLTDERYFKALCRNHHRWVEENPTDAKSMGLSASRLRKQE